MSNIQKLDSSVIISQKRDLITKLGETSAKIIWSRQNEDKALNQTVPKLSLEINKFVVSAYAILGQNIDDSQILMTCKLFSEEVKRYHSNLTITEIGIAIDEGAKHSDDNYISVKNLLKWVKTYTETTRQKALIAHKEQQEKDFEESERIKLEKGDIQFKNEIESMYQHYLNHGEIESYDLNFRAIAYMRIEKNGLFEVALELKKKMYQEAFSSLDLPVGDLDMRDYEAKQICRAKSLLIAFEMFQFNEQLNVFDNA